jgi:hypothetical protein
MAKSTKKTAPKKKAKRKLEYRLALSDLDTFIYLFVCAASVIGAIVLFVHQLLARDNLALSDKSIIAYSDSGSGVLFFSLPLIILMLCSGITIWKYYFKAMRPLFGRRDFEYGDDLEYGEYPLFYRGKPTDAESLKQKKKRTRKALIISAIFAVCLVLFPYSIAPRESLTYSGDIIRYNVFNSETHRYSKDDIKQVTFRTERKTRRRGRHGRRISYNYLMTVTMDDGNQFDFYPGGFRLTDAAGRAGIIKSMLYAKDMFGEEIVTIGSTEYIDKVVQRGNFTDREIQLLYELFEIK